MNMGKNLFASEWRAFFKDRAACAGLLGIGMLFLFTLAAPLIANGRPLIMVSGSGWSFPFLRSFFAPDSSEILVEKSFNYMLTAIIFLLPQLWFPRRWRKWSIIISAVLLLLPFVLISPRMDKTDYRKASGDARYVMFAPVAYGPDEIAGIPGAAPDAEHFLGCDEIGRDLAARVIYGGRVSLAVGLLSAAIAVCIGVTVGLMAGFFRGWFDLLGMRMVEILLCFPTFLLLLILMSMLGDAKIGQSIPLVIAVIGFTGWLQIAFLVRGEVLKQSAMPYIQSCKVSGISAGRIMFGHLLPNILPPVLISLTFMVAGAIISESGLSFLGFGVQPPTASWGNLMRQAFDNPFLYWHLTFFPGLALFTAVLSFNFLGEGLRRAFDSGGTR
ncbi:MAG: ABC transporter permease [Lentisphaeria bacterium]|nr:ABC transporter permease [Lentisphaeria bacterium]